MIMLCMACVAMVAGVNMPANIPANAKPPIILGTTDTGELTAYITKISPQTTIEADCILSASPDAIPLISLEGVSTNPDISLQYKVEGEVIHILITNEGNELMQGVNVPLGMYNVAEEGYYISYTGINENTYYSSQQVLEKSAFRDLFRRYPFLLPIFLMAIQVISYFNFRGQRAGYWRSLIPVILVIGASELLLNGVIINSFAQTPYLAGVWLIINGMMLSIELRPQD